MPETQFIDFDRRFGGIERLYGAQSLERLAQMHVAVAGIGGVGSWCAEALARSGVGALTLIDLDHISESNVNRQLHALTDTLGQSKIEAMARRIHGINPECRVQLQDDFVTPENSSRMLDRGLNVLIDCTDEVSAKIGMILEARKRRLPIVVCGGAGGKTNSLSLRAGDLSMALNDALLASVRNRLRRSHGYPKASASAGKSRKRPPKMNVRSLWIDQPVILPSLWRATGVHADGDAELQGLSCSGYGSIVTVTASMGMAAAGEAMHWLLNGRFQ